MCQDGPAGPHRRAWSDSKQGRAGVMSGSRDGDGPASTGAWGCAAEREKGLTSRSSCAASPAAADLAAKRLSETLSNTRHATMLDAPRARGECAERQQKHIHVGKIADNNCSTWTKTATKTAISGPGGHLAGIS